MIDRNEIEGKILSAIDAAFCGNWWQHICYKTQEEIRDNLSVIWDEFYPSPPKSDNSEAVEQPLTGDKSKPADICSRCNGAGVLSSQGADVCCPSCGGTGK